MSSQSPSSPLPDEQLELDPVFLHSRREAGMIFCVWLVCFLWSVPFCYLNGYHYDPETFSTTWGMPSWLFWGIGVPWIISDIITTIFCLYIIQNDDLGETHAGLDLEKEIHQMHASEKEGNQ